jgi:acetylornithine deacetylase/succinyl-diaminopimelate desuccinylase-like protein
MAADDELRELVFARLAEWELAQAVAGLVATPSENPPGGEAAVAAALADLAVRWGLVAHVEPVAEGRSNVHVTTGDRAVDGPDVLMVGHLDTVPADPTGWTRDPFAGLVVDGNVWGRGSVDMKGGLGAMLAALAALHDVAPDRAARAQLYAVAGEEVDCLGSRTLVATGRLPAAHCLVVGEPDRAAGGGRAQGGAAPRSRRPRTRGARRPTRARRQRRHRHGGRRRGVRSERTSRARAAPVARPGGCRRSSSGRARRSGCTRSTSTSPSPTCTRRPVATRRC